MGDPGRVPRRPRQPRPRADREGDDLADRHGAHRRPGREAAADGAVQRLRQAPAVGPAPRADADREGQAQGAGRGRWRRGEGWRAGTGGLALNPQDPGSPVGSDDRGSSTEPDDDLVNPEAVDLDRIDLNDADIDGGIELDYLAARLINGRLGGRPIEQAVDLKRIESAVREILVAIGEDPDRDGLRRTPTRVAHAYAEMF